MRLGVVLVLAVAACTLPEYAGSDVHHDAGAGSDSGSGSGSAAGDDDEDGDGVPNEIDTCPHLRDAPQMDSDLDGIGNDCDPHPFDDATPDHMVFITFNVSSPAIVIEGETHVVDAGTLDLGEILDDHENVIWTRDSFATAKAAVGFEVIDVGNGAFERIGLHANRTGMTPGQFNSDACFVDKLDQSSLQNYVQEIPVVHSPASVIVVPLEHLTAMMQITVGDPFACQTTADGNTHPVLTMNPTYGPGQVGVSAHGARIRLHYLFVAGR